MKIDLLTPDLYQKMPWKNGKGTTNEIAIFPPGSTLAKNDFFWRLSSADISEDGPFSPIPTYDRHLAIIEGPGVNLTFADGEEPLLPGEVLNFRGDQAVYSRLLKGPIKDLGLMIKSDYGFANFEILKLNPQQIEFGQGTHLIFVISGSLLLQHVGSSTEKPIAIEKFQTAVFVNADALRPEFYSVLGIPGTQFAFIQIHSRIQS